MSVLINDLYYGHTCECCGGFENAARQGIVFSPEALAKGLESIYKGLNVRDEIEDHIFRETLRLFNEAASKGFTDSEWPDVPDEFINQIRTNNAIWSAFRVHRMQNDIASKLIDENGQLKKFDRWVEDIKGMTNHYVGPWLRTEYNTAVLRAHQAADWKHFEAEADIFPNVRWMPTTSPQQDPLHRQYWEKKLTLPVNHPFWEKHRPGDRWNCKCTLQQTDDPVNDEVIRDFYPVPQQDGLDNNPADDGKLFSDSHPYIAKAYKGARYAVEKLLSRTDDEPPFASEYKKTAKGQVLISPHHGANEVEENKRLAIFLTGKLHKKIYLLPRIDSDTAEQLALREKLIPKGVMPRKNPDFMIGGQFFEGKSMLEVKPSTDEKIIKEAIFNRIKKAKKQADNIIIEMPSHIRRDQINRHIRGYLRQSKKQRIIIVKWKNKAIVFSNDNKK